MIFAMDFAINVLREAVTSSEIDLEEEVLESWDVSGLPTAVTLCDSAEVVLDSSLVNALLSIYSLGFAAGVEEGERFIMQDMQDSVDVDMDEISAARASFEKYHVELLSMLQEVELERTPSAESPQSD